uniref:THAP-type domain-containing protein n=1 Tax=Sinocyclocheilus rhinocerous TaxID=307959 RepID=A0A673LBJ8_9TELE
MAPKITRRCAVPNCRQTQSLHNLPSDPNIRKEWISFIFNEVLDHISKRLVVCSLHFTPDSFTNKAQFDAGFSERLKLKDDSESVFKRQQKTSLSAEVKSSS